MKSLSAAVLFVLGTALAGCGQKGPLVLPDAPSKHRTLPSLPVKPAPGTGTSAAPANPAPAGGDPAPGTPPPTQPTQP